MTKQTDHSTYICEECGNTTPVPSEECQSCGGKMVPLDGEEATDLEQPETQESGEESLETLRNEEEDEAEAEYRNTFQDSDNLE